MCLTKEYIVFSVYNHLNISRTKSVDLVESVLEIIKRSLAIGEDVLISGFGKFCVLDKKKRRGRNLQTGEDLMLEPRRLVTFKC